MQIRIFTISVLDNQAQTDELNAFLRGQKVLTVEQQIVTVSNQPFWSFCVKYIPQGNPASAEKATKVDYKEVLDADSFAVFATLRTIRKQLAEQDAVPAYAVFTDSELAEIAKLDSIDETTIRKIPGIGQKKIEKYGRTLCESYLRSQTELPLQ